MKLRFEQRIIKSYYEKLLQKRQISEFYKHLRFEQRIIKNYYEKLLQKRQISEFYKHLRFEQWIKKITMKNCYNKDKLQIFKNISDLTIGAVKTIKKR